MVNSRNKKQKPVEIFPKLRNGTLLQFYSISYKVKTACRVLDPIQSVSVSCFELFVHE